MGFIKNKYKLYFKIGVTFILTSIFVQSYAQSNGLNFQGVARNASGVILASQKISLKFSIIANSENGAVEYIESRIVNTNAQGIFSVVIGDTSATNVVGNFTSINWKQIPKFLKVEMDPQGGTSFVNMGTTQLQKVPYAYYANGVNAANVDGILPVASGGTGVASISALKSTLGIDQINNTSDLSKPISNATQAALDLKATLASPTFTGTVSGINKSMVGLSSVDNTSDLSKPISTATQAALDLKAPLASPTFTGTVSGISKSMVGLSNVDNTSDLLKPLSTATINALNAKATATEVTSSLLLKENISNKSSNILLGTSNDLYPTQNAVKAYVDAQINSGGVADNGITTVKIMDANVTNAKLADNSVSTTKIIDGTIVSADISNSAAIPFSKLNITKSDINGLGIPSNTDLTTYSAGNGLTLAGSVFSIGAGAITTTTIADGAISTAKLADASINTAKLADNSVSTSKIIDGTIVSADISNTAAIPFSKLNITKSDINGLGIPSNTDLSTYSAGNGLTLTGSVFSIGAGAITTTTIADGAISTAKLADNSVSTAKIIDGTIVSADISNTAAIPFSKLSISKSDINGLGIPSNTDLTIYSAGNGLTLTGSVFSIGAGAITTTTIADGAISTAKIADASVTSSKISGVLSVSNGGTGLATLTSNSVLVGNGTSTVNFVAPGASGNVLKSDGTSWVSGTVSSSSSFSSDLSIQGSTFGLGGGNKSNSVAIGNYALHSNSSGVYNTAVGAFALATNTSGNDNTAIGNTSLYGLTTGYQNIAIGSGAMQSVTSGYNNTSVGYLSDIGTFANGGIYNSTAIGYNAVANSNNTIQLGNNQISSVNTAGKITTGAITFPNTDGTNGQVLSTNGSGSIGWTNMSTSGTINVGYVPYGYTSPSLAGNFTYDATSKLNYIRIGNMVLFNGYIGKFSQNAGTRSTVNFALPIASNFINKTDAIGTVSADNSTSTGVTGAVYASPSDDNLIVSFITTNTTATDIFISFSGSYIIK